MVINMFSTYVSNIAAGSGNNCIFLFDSEKTLHCRCYAKALLNGTFPWRFWFGNTVDSTYDRGQEAFPDRSGGHWHIVSAYIADGGVNVGDPLTACTPVLFDGKAEKDVQPDEKFWSDEVTFSTQEGHYLVWDWVITGNGIPYTPDSQIPAFVDSGNGLKEDLCCPKPNLFGCKRPYKKRIAFFGDSITQGCGTTLDGYDMWAGRLATVWGKEYAVWNLGLGWGRASDTVTGKAWMQKALQNDTVIVAFGTNDINTGSYQNPHEDSPTQVLSSLEAIVSTLGKAGKRVILFTAPPFDMIPSIEANRRTVNAAIPQLAAKYGMPYFDFASVLCRPEDIGQSLYGSHPDGNGGAAVAKAFLESGILL